MVCRKAGAGRHSSDITNTIMSVNQEVAERTANRAFAGCAGRAVAHFASTLYALQREKALPALASTLWELEQEAVRSQRIARLRRHLPPPTYTHLFGVDTTWLCGPGCCYRSMVMLPSGTVAACMAHGTLPNCTLGCISSSVPMVMPSHFLSMGARGLGSGGEVPSPLHPCSPAPLLKHGAGEGIAVRVRQAALIRDRGLRIADWVKEWRRRIGPRAVRRS